MPETKAVDPGSPQQIMAEETARRRKQAKADREASLQKKVRRLEEDIRNLEEENRKLRERLIREALQNPPGITLVEV